MAGLSSVTSGPRLSRVSQSCSHWGAHGPQPVRRAGVEVVWFNIDCGHERGGAQFVIDEKRPKNTKPRQVAVRLLQREVLLKRQVVLFGGETASVGERRHGTAMCLG